jgi:hypothetical protein
MHLGLNILQQLTRHAVHIPETVYHLEKHTVVSQQDQRSRMMRYQVIVKPL